MTWLYISSFKKQFCEVETSNQPFYRYIVVGISWTNWGGRACRNGNIIHAVVTADIPLYLGCRLAVFSVRGDTLFFNFDHNFSDMCSTPKILISLFRLIEWENLVDDWTDLFHLEASDHILKLFS